MAALTVKRQSLPLRCEICHQPDLFDASLNHCLRCSEIRLPQADEPEKINFWLASWRRLDRACYLFFHSSLVRQLGWWSRHLVVLCCFIFCMCNRSIIAPILHELMWNIYFRIMLSGTLIITLITWLAIALFFVILPGFGVTMGLLSIFNRIKQRQLAAQLSIGSSTEQPD